VAGLSLGTRVRRLAVVPIVCFLAALTTYVALWTCYGFRFSPTPQSQKHFDMQNLLLTTKFNRVQTGLTSATQVTQEMLDRQSPGIIADAIMWADRHQFLPQAWLYGFLYTYTSALIRHSYLLGQTSLTGWWYYFPCAMLFKTPTATLTAIPLAIAGCLFSYRHSNLPGGPARWTWTQAIAGWIRRADWWSIICLALPPALYAHSAMSTVVNLGIRHILPVYPFIFIGIAVGLARLMPRWMYVGRAGVALLVIGLAAESLPAWPNYIPFFNTPSRTWQDPIDLLGDSNLDWGQDLKLLSAWQQDHSDRPLYLAYFGLADPSAHGVNAIQLPPLAGGSPFASETQMPQGRCYLAISATHLQGMYIHAQVASQIYAPLRKRTPAAILGGSIYVYELP
jgi:hypothetical protein